MSLLWVPCGSYRVVWEKDPDETAAGDCVTAEGSHRVIHILTKEGSSGQGCNNANPKP